MEFLKRLPPIKVLFLPMIEWPPFSAQYGIYLLHSSPYYAQTNGQAEAANKAIRNKATGCTPFQLVSGQEAILPLEITVSSLRVLKQNLLNPEQYDTAMLQRLDDVHEDRMMALENIRMNKAKVARAYKKKARRRAFHEGDLVRKAVLPEGFKDNTFGKWSPMWEGPYQVSKVLPNGAYRLMSIDGMEHRNFINAKHLKGYMSPLEF
ncbi:uncharacterized protein LOC127252816 [Andrographis paniculata]|uniref:uncharacterized protein LOC127252816 n=1 Tax=Andrographis paniculata TaxID=175694 RepID=UPI0021E83D62|nr:uncharacterized protein LOC127252816 [Andrographis paniculata]